MRTDDLATFSGLGAALWADSGRSHRVAVDALAAVSVLNLDEDRSLEKASAALLAQAEREGARAAGEAIGSPFYRLLPEERFTLWALHRGRWSYARIARILGKSEERIPVLAWAARLHLASAPGRGVPQYPSAGRGGYSCPDYSPNDPWTQRFLDEEMPAEQKLFLQNHVAACDSCQQTLLRSKILYYHADSELPRFESKQASSMQSAWRAIEGHRSPETRTFLESLRIFSARSEVRWALGVGAVLALYLLTR